MRVVAGKYRHRIIQMTQLDTTRETQDLVRGAIFNMIGPYFEGGTALDLFSGSGAMGIEALSRGIQKVHFNDVVAEAIAITKANCTNLKIENASFSILDYKDFLKQTNLQWDIIFLDPPYKMDQAEELLRTVLPFVTHNGRIVYELAIATEYPLELGSLKLIKNKTYGIKRVLVYEMQV